MELQDVSLQNFVGSYTNFRSLYMLFSDGKESFSVGVKLEGTAKEIAANMRMVAQLMEEKG